MKNKNIWVNTLVYNEENFLWFAIMSVAKYVDKILIWDSGSTDNTLKVIDGLRKKIGEKIIFKEVGRVNKEEYTEIRQQMLDQTKSDWLLILDGDEIWWDNSIKKVTKQIQEKGDSLDSIVAPFYNCLGDIFHYQDESVGKYEMDGKTGNITIRFINKKIPGLHLRNSYGQEGYFDSKNTSIQKRNKKRRIFLEAPFIHLTHLKRTSRTNPKFKHELGKTFPEKFKFPEVFYIEHPDFIESPFKKRGIDFLIKSSLLTVPRSLKRKIYG